MPYLCKNIYKQKTSIMKKVILAIGLALLSIGAFAQNTLPAHCITILGSVNLNGGAEGLIETEYFFNSNHKTSLYAAADYHYAKEDLWDEGYDARKCMAEIGWKMYFPVIKDTFYPFIGLGLTAGMQTCTKIKATTLPTYLLGGVGTIGMEYMFAPTISAVVSCRFKYDDVIHYVIGGGL